MCIRDSPYAVMAHRGSTFWAPEETESAWRWAREMGADYLESDLQCTKDGVDVYKRQNHIFAQVIIDRSLPQHFATDNAGQIGSFLRSCLLYTSTLSRVAVTASARSKWKAP